MNRRHWLQATSFGALGPALASIATALPTAARAAGAPLKIGFIYSGPISNVGWTFQHDLGRKLVEKTYGKQVETVFVESVPESADAERVIRQLIADGCKMAKNVGIYQTRFYEGAYLLGMLAGKMTKSNSLGFVASFPIPEVLRNINAFTHGARSVNPKAHTKVVWINSWYDPTRERDAAVALSGQGCDVFYQNTDSPAIVQFAQSKGLYAFGQDSDMASFGPKAQLSANTVNWGVYYVEKVKAALAGQWKPEDTKWGMKEGMIELPALNPAVPADVARLFNDKKAAILAGKFHPFGGVVKDQSGAIKVAEGQVISEAELWSMKWYIEGVDGKLPG
jgi:basic membrane protein A